MELARQKILLTGGTSGIGFELTKHLYLKKNKVIVVGRNREKLEKLQEEFTHIETVEVDLSASKDVQYLIEKVQKEHKDLNILINNAGIQNTYYSRLFGTSKKDIVDIEKEIHVNLISPIQLSAGIIGIIKNNPTKAIINITSGLGYAPKMSAPVYCATKGGLSVFTRALRYHYEKLGVRVIEVFPPLTDTPMTQGRGTNKMHPRDVALKCIEMIEYGNEEIGIGSNENLMERFSIDKKSLLNEFKYY